MITRRYSKKALCCGKSAAKAHNIFVLCRQNPWCRNKRQRDGQEENMDIDQRPIALMDMFDSDEEEVDNMYEA